MFLDFGISRIPALKDTFTDYMRAHIKYRLEFTRQAFGIFNATRLDFDNSGFVTCRQYSAPAVEYNSTLRLIRNLAFLLLKALLDVMIVPVKLKIKTTHRLA